MKWVKVMHSLSGMETGSVELFLQSRRGIPEGPCGQNRTTDMDNFFKYYFLGIGGIGMSALARYFNAQRDTTARRASSPTGWRPRASRW